MDLEKTGLRNKFVRWISRVMKKSSSGRNNEEIMQRKNGSDWPLEEVELPDRKKPRISMKKFEVQTLRCSKFCFFFSTKLKFREKEERSNEMHDYVSYMIGSGARLCAFCAKLFNGSPPTLRHSDTVLRFFFSFFWSFQVINFFQKKSSS